MKCVRTTERRWIALPLVMLLAGCGEKPKVVVEVQSEKDANEILVALRGYSPEKSAQKSGQSTVFQIKVEPDRFQDALQVLIANNLPRNEHGGFEAMLDSAGLIPTRTDERARFLHAREQELEESLELIDGVLNARVHLVMPEKDRYEIAERARAASKPVEGTTGGGGDSAAPDSNSTGLDLGGSSASIVLRYNPKRPPTGLKSDESPGEDLQSRVTRVVAGAVEGLDRNRVEVFLQAANLDYAGGKQQDSGSSTESATAGDSANDSEVVRAALAELDQAKKDRIYAILASVALAVLLLFSLIRSMKRR